MVTYDKGTYVSGGGIRNYQSTKEDNAILALCTRYSMHLHGRWRAQKYQDSKEREFHTASEPNPNLFVTDKDERERGDCLPDAINAV